MKKVLLASTTCLAFACGSAVAADMPVKAPIMKAAPAVSWTGCYIGVEGGGKWDRVTNTSRGNFAGVVDTTGGAAFTNPYDSSGVFAGGTLGCNYQVTNWVFGLEGDFSGSASTGSGDLLGLTAPFTPTTVQEFTHERWLATARARVGFLWDPNTLFFVTGGAAWSNFSTSILTPPAVLGESDTVLGWTVGGGIEYMFPGTNWSAKAEYAYIQFNTINAFQAGPVENFNEKISEHLFRVGLNYHFGNTAPVVAKY